MLRNTLSLIIIFLPILLCGQDYDKIFKIADVSSDLPSLLHSALFKAEESQLSKLHSDKNKEIRLTIPYAQGKYFNITLQEKQIFSSDYQLTQKGTNRSTTDGEESRGRYYSGKVVGTAESMVNLSIYDNRIAGIIRYKDKTYNIGKYSESNYHIIYEANDLTEDLSFNCESIESEKRSISQQITKTGTTCNTAINIYFECDYAMYLNFNSDIVLVQDYVTDVFNEMSTLYDNEDITILISQIVVWTTNDPYVDNSSGLYNFKDDLVANGFNGDVAQLLTNDPGSNGGIAYVDQLCGSFPYAYADINNSYNPYPTYSWDVQVITHEIGHVLGSRHTHQCVWGPNNDQQIDDCGNIAASGGGSCYNPSAPIVPAAGGTIMSYCHTQSVGINFAEGFGTEPGDLIRQKHAGCMCDNSTCNTATTLTTSGIYYAHANNGNGASNNNATHADWFVFQPDSNGVVTAKSCGEGVDTRLWLHSGSCSSLTYETYSDDDCDVGNGSNYASEIFEYSVNAGTTYYIEWDNRWSSSAFDWEFIYVADTMALLTITCPQDYTGNNLCDNTSHAPSMTGYASSNDGAATISYNDDITPTSCYETIVRTWLATDDNGNTSSCNQSIEIEDNDVPTIINCPNSITVASDSNCVYVYALSSPQASDNCDTALDEVSNIQIGDPLAIGTHSIIYTFTDDCGNSEACNFNISVIDSCSIDIFCPNGHVGIRTCDVGIDGNPIITGQASSSINNAVITYADTATSITCAIEIERHWSATNPAGNVATCTQTIDLEDTESPIILDCPNDTIVGSDQNCVFVYNYYAPTATDNCTINLTEMANYIPGSTFSVGVTEVVYTFTDECNNEADCIFSVQVTDQCTPCDGIVLNINGMISDSSYNAKMELNSNGMLMSGEESIFHAGQTIQLNEGFEVQAGAVFEASIDDCINN